MEHSNTILESWQANAANWITTIDNNEIESRKLVTNAAIVDAICEYHQGSIIDIGCGEGWLTRALVEKGFGAQGIDAIAALINNAKRKGGATYTVGSYADIVSEKVLQSQVFDSAVINFALLDKEDTEKLIHHIHKLLKKEGLLFIQTLHPLAIATSGSYMSGWKEGSWTGLKQNFVQPYQWYFRTLQDWCDLFSNSGLSILNIKEPLHPETEKPVSIIFILKAH